MATDNVAVTHGEGANGRTPVRNRRDGHSGPVGRRTVGLLLALWTTLIAAWLVSAIAGGTLTTPAVGLAVAGLIGVVWLIGLLILGAFLVSPRE